MMKEMTLQEIQAVSLDILKDVHDFCVKNNIRYTLYGGTMIGAIRHHGFIPWDDDVDIAMPRPDYERFISSYKSENGYKLKCHERGDSLLAFARVCEMKRTLVTQSLPWSKESTGVYIDVFPLDGAPDGELQAEQFIKNLYWSWNCIKLSRVAKRKLSDQKTWSRRVNVLVRKLLFGNPLLSNVDWTKRHIRKCKKIPFGSTLHFANIAFMEYRIKEYQELKDFQSTVMAPFEGEEFCVCNGYDHLMRTKYGDYMQLPPEEERRVKHGGSGYFWLD